MEIIDRNKFFVVQADCIPVKGYKRSCLYDLTRKKYYFIPNSLAEILSEYNRLPINKLYQDFDNNPVLDEYFKFLTEKEIIYLADEWELEHFPNLCLDWKHPSKISTALIEVNETTQFDCIKLQALFDSLGIKHLQIRQVSLLRLDFITQLLTGLIDSRLKSIELILPFTIDYINISKAFKKINPKTLLIYFFASQDNKSILEPALPRIILTKDPIESFFVEKSPNPKYFAVNIQSFTEAQQHHTFYNRKLFIDKQGQVKNSLFNAKTFGHIDLIDVAAIVGTEEFQEFWFIEKDNTSVCKDCEFRYMCTDQRVPKKSGDQWVHSIDCRYNPYVAKWAWEEGFEIGSSTIVNQLHENQNN